MRIRTSKFGGFFARIRVFAVVAQLVEQHIRNVKVPSSIPGNGTKYTSSKNGKTQMNPLFNGGCWVFLRL